MIILQNVERSWQFGEIAKTLKIPKEEIILAIDCENPVNSIEDSIFFESNTNESINILDTLSTNKDEQSLITNKITINKIIEELKDKEREIILLRYYKDKTQSEVGRILGISQVQVSRIEKKVLEKMKKELLPSTVKN